MKVDNATNCPFTGAIYTDYGWSINWNATKGRDEFIRQEYVRAYNGMFLRKRTGRYAEFIGNGMNIGPWMNIPFTAQWIYHNEFIWMLHHKGIYILRNYEIDKTLV